MNGLDTILKLIGLFILFLMLLAGWAIKKDK